MARGLPRVGATRRVRVGTLSECISEGRIASDAMCTFPIGGRCAVTICIAAISNWTDGKTEEIVTASDHMVTTGDHTADNVIRKIEPIHAHWHAMFATDGDISSADYILDGVRAILREKPALRVEDVMSTFVSVYKRYLKDEIENSVLAPLDMTLAQFRRNGLKQLAEKQFTPILNRVNATSTGCEFLVCGFERDGHPCIFTMSEIGKIRRRDRLGFWAIGSGQATVMSSLFFHQYSRLLGPLPAIYHLCEAKFMPGTADGVGKCPTSLTSLTVRFDRDKTAIVPELHGPACLSRVVS